MPLTSALLPAVRMPGRRVSRTTAEDLLLSEGSLSASGVQEIVPGSAARDPSVNQAPIAVVSPKSKRPTSANPRRVRALFASTSSSPSSIATTADWASEACEAGGMVGRGELATVAQAEGWHLVWSRDDQPALSPESPPAGVEAVLVVHERGSEATTRLVRSLLQAGGLGLPVFVLLFDMCGAARADFDVATALQRECLDEGAEDVLCNSRTAAELRLAVAMAMHRRTVKLEASNKMHTRFAKEAERGDATRARDIEEAVATGLFWQTFDRFCKDFPSMDFRLPRDVGLGTRLGPCTLDCVLGQGGRGKVYGAAIDRSGAREAVKAIAKSAITQCKSASALYREVDHHRRLEHEHVVRLLGVLHGPLHVFVRMEDASHGNLFKLMQSATESIFETDAKRYQGQLSDAVVYCHSQGVAHRDLRPENIALDASGLNVKVMDFASSVRATGPRTDVVGGLPCIAPETLLAGDGFPYEPAGVDIWACGVVLIDLLLGLNHFSQLLGWEPATRVSPKRHGELSQYFGDALAIQRILWGRYGEADVSDLVDLLQGMLQVAPEQRWSARRVAASRWPTTR